MANFSLYPAVMVKVDVQGDPFEVEAQDEEGAKASFMARIDLDEIEAAVSRCLPEGVYVVGIDLELVPGATVVVERGEG